MLFESSIPFLRGSIINNNVQSKFLRCFDGFFLHFCNQAGWVTTFDVLPEENGASAGPHIDLRSRRSQEAGRGLEGAGAGTLG